MTKLYVVIPCYNEQEVLPETAKRLREKMEALRQAQRITADSRIVLVNDGSRDETWNIICTLHSADPLFSGIDLSRNRGHQNALLAGLMTVREEAEAVISMDADLQDDINAMDAMLEKYENGCEIVYGVRSKRKTDSAFKRMTAEGFYHVMKLLGADLVFNHADYRLMSRRALDALAEFDEVNLFLRGMVPMVGFRSDCVYYERSERFAGESKYPLKKMLSFAFEGITSLSDKPLRMISALGAILACGGALAFLIVLILGKLSLSAFLATSLFFLSGLQLLAIGVVGQYVGKVYLETKHRPRYIIRDYLH